jgi:hypothetical protein
MENSMEAPQKCKNTAILLLGIYPKASKSGYNKGTFTTMFIAALFTTVELWKQPRCLTTINGLRK